MVPTQRTAGLSDLEHPALFTRQVGEWLCLVNFHHPHRSGLLRQVADGTEMGLGGTLCRDQRRLWLLAFMPEQQLLNRQKGDEQRDDSPEALLDMKSGDAKMGGTLTIHPETPPHPSGDLVEAL